MGISDSKFHVANTFYFDCAANYTAHVALEGGVGGEPVTVIGIVGITGCREDPVVVVLVSARWHVGDERFEMGDSDTIVLHLNLTLSPEKKARESCRSARASSKSAHRSMNVSNPEDWGHNS